MHTDITLTDVNSRRVDEIWKKERELFSEMPICVGGVS